ncbi:MAG: VanZ family protein [Clostridia bacterium]|nr:VanZ family protein [Clostridia bacterium]
MVAYIFSNSLKSQKKSNDTSTKITEQIKPIIDPKDKIPPKELNHKIRKTAHCIEFGILGIFLALLFDSIKKCFNKTDIFAPLLFALAVAVADEYIQTFNDRGSQVEDILIDFGGATAGLFLVFIFALLLRKKYKT